MPEDPSRAASTRSLCSSTLVASTRVLARESITSSRLSAGDLPPMAPSTGLCATAGESSGARWDVSLTYLTLLIVHPPSCVCACLPFNVHFTSSLRTAHLMYHT